MFSSILFFKPFNPIIVIVIVCSATLYGLSVPMIMKKVYATEAASARFGGYWPFGPKSPK